MDLLKVAGRRLEFTARLVLKARSEIAPRHGK